ncbi:hypothetical protein OS493_020566 [Desmophyllum pertusum]|uniref:NACHT domain-containing protein n=1 Tax=Desmophyllum pertusum TaxID=174260 RepID=A0A9W9YZ84_9CNID|nr:hypothetical protein OS493_020566 [Desmophyllum pertusum]
MSEDNEETSQDYEDTSSDKFEENQKTALKKFELVLVINLKEVSKCRSLRDVISRCSIFPEEETALTEGLLSYITNNQEKVLLVFDGYDEYRCGSNSEIYDIFRGKKLRNCCVLITTRISKGDELREFKDVHAEITGFSEEDREAFMRRMLGGETEAKELRSLLSRENLEDLARVPLLLLFFCTLWKKGKLNCFPESKTKLYLAIVQHVLYYSQGKLSPARFGKVEDFKEILAEIGKVALECLLKDDHVFEYDQLSAAILCEESLIIGLLQVSEYAENLQPAGMVSFIHKSIQEFLAAWYITYRCVPNGNLGGIEEHAPTLEDCEAWENVFQFICGLSDDGAVKVLEHLTSVRISDPTLDLSKIIPDVENETDVPLCDVTRKHRRFSTLVYNSFQEVHSKAELLSRCFNCTGGTVLVTKQLTELLQKAKVKDLTQVTHSVNFLHSTDGNPFAFSQLNELVEFLVCLHVPLRITKSSEALTVEDFLRKFQDIGCDDCKFNSILCFRNGQFSVLHNRVGTWTVMTMPDYLKKLLTFLFHLSPCVLTSVGTVKLASLLPRFNNIIKLCLDLSDCCASAVDTLVPSITHKTLRRLGLSGISLTPAVAAALGRSLPEMSSLEKLELTGAKGSIVQAEEMEALFGGFNKTLPLEHLTFSGFSVSGCLAPLTKSFRFFPNLRNLYLGEFNMDERNLCHLLESLTFIPNLEELRVTGKQLSHAHCCTAEVNTAASFTHKTLRSLELSGISLTPAAAAALGRSLPEMSSLQDSS